MGFDYRWENITDGPPEHPDRFSKYPSQVTLASYHLDVTRASSVWSTLLGHLSH